MKMCPYMSGITFLSHNELRISNRIFKQSLEIFVRGLMGMRSRPFEGEEREDRTMDDSTELKGEVRK